MDQRRFVRETALKLLFAHDHQGAEASADALMQGYLECFSDELPPQVRDAAVSFCAGVIENRDAIDERIGRASTNWRVERMSTVDRSVLRLATYELITRSGTPTAVILNEAVELAKTFGSEKSAAFVNGVLDKLARARSEG